MRSYGQFCPIARGSEILAERWTPIILRNLLLGCRTFNELAAGAPGLSRALLARRLRELERAGVLEIRPKPNSRGSVYEPTPAGEDLVGVLVAIDDPLAFARWHMGRIEWAAALRAGGIVVTGPRTLRQALPTWNAGPEENARMRAEHGLPVADLG
jgi:DNA-binding HxlR family transcriptional regulator